MERRVATNSGIPAIVDGVSKLCGLAKVALAEGAGTAPIVRAVSCYETRQARQRNGKDRAMEKEKQRGTERDTQAVEQRASQPGGGQTSRPRLFPPRSFPSSSSSFILLAFSFFCCFPSHGSCHAGGPCRVKTTYVPGEAPGSRSVASRPTASPLSLSLPPTVSLAPSPAQ